MINNEPVPTAEEPILECLLNIRNDLFALKQNRQKYLNSRTIYEIYHKVLIKVHHLFEIRYSEKNSMSHSNRVDSVLDDVMQIISLSFITCGLKNTAPATFAHLSTVQRLLEHLEESKVYTVHDLSPIKERLDEIEEIVKKNAYNHVHSEDTTKDNTSTEFEDISAIEKENDATEDLLLKNKLDECILEYNRIESKIESIDPKLTQYVESLYSLRRQLLSVTISFKNNGNKLFVHHTIKESMNNNTPLKEEAVAEDDEDDDEIKAFIKNCSSKLKEIDESELVLSGLAQSLSGFPVFSGLLDECHDLVNDLIHQKVYVDDNNNYYENPFLQQIYQKLIDTKTSLENLVVTRRWTLRETDLFSYQKQLNDIEKLRVGPTFKNPEDPKGDAFENEKKSPSILIYLLRRCYAIIYKLLESSEPISESMQRIHNQLSTVRRCLLEIKRMGGVDDERELYPYQLKLASIDNMRVDGKFYDEDGNIPEGQGSLNVLLSECFDIVQELKIEADERDASSILDSDDEMDDLPIEEMKNDDLSTNKSRRRDSVPFTKDPTNRDISELERPNEEKEIEELRKQFQKLKYEKQKKMMDSSYDDSEDLDYDDSVSEFSYGSSVPVSLTPSHKL
ncbi:related to UPF0662 protein YPL260W [Hanseniaspora guilliermondii]|uniref:Related to UPF0662 protein YPL260W n=1 Tax=Hanseniaspora guilliermondii TaxID=56406 RepID=A0A1L0CXS4_9ASCO|nr:related to UPF0662 protein YPL260W [Hanseniaspora guilliermondii]